MLNILFIKSTSCKFPYVACFKLFCFFDTFEMNLISFSVPTSIMAEEKALEFINTSPHEDASAYSANYGAHKEGMTREDVAEYYSKWAESGGYEKVINMREMSKSKDSNETSL